MSPEKFNEETRSAGIINGPRPSPLRINKDSHVIQKPSNMNISGQVKVTRQHDPKLKKSQRQPVIIYTHSPKIIHTKPRDFMALVQKLTGFSRLENQVEGAESEKNDQIATSFEGKSRGVNTISHEDNDSSSLTSDEKYEDGNIVNVKEDSSAVSPINKGLNPYLAEIPLFTPNSNNLFYSPQPVSRHPYVLLPSPINNIIGSISPSFLDFMKGIPEY